MFLSIVRNLYFSKSCVKCRAFAEALSTVAAIDEERVLSITYQILAQTAIVLLAIVLSKVLLYSPPIILKPKDRSVTAESQLMCYNFDAESQQEHI